MFLLKILVFFLRNILRIVRFILVSGATFAGVLYVIDMFTESRYGIANLYLIAGALVFFPLFAGLFVEFLLNEVRRGRSTVRKKNVGYLNEDVGKNSLMK